MGVRGKCLNPVGRCDTCNVEFNSALQQSEHYNGARHKHAAEMESATTDAHDGKQPDADTSNPCKWFLVGICKRGPKCKFYHPPPGAIAAILATSTSDDATEKSSSAKTSKKLGSDVNSQEDASDDKFSKKQRKNNHQVDFAAAVKRKTGASEPAESAQTDGAQTGKKKKFDD